MDYRILDVGMTTWWERFFTTTDEGDPFINDPLLAAHAAATGDYLGHLDCDVFRLPTVVAGRGLIADTAAMLPMYAVHDAGNVIDPTPTILRRPDPSEPYRRTIERLCNSMTRHGGAVIEILANGSAGHPIALRVIDHDRCNLSINATDYRIVELSIDGQALDPARYRYLPFVSDDGPLGDTPLRIVQERLYHLAAAYDWSAAYYGSGGVPPYAITHPTRLTAKQARALGDQWLAARMERRPPVLSGGIELSTFNVPSAAEALPVAAIDSLDAVIARVLRIPPSLLNTMSQGSLTYSTTAGEFHRWLVLGLYPLILSRIEAAFSELLPRGTSAVFDTRNLTRGDLAGDELSSADDPAAPEPLPTGTR